MTTQGSGECGSCATTGNTTVARRLSTMQTPRAARPFTPDTAPSGRADLLKVRKASTMANSNDDGAPRPQAVVAGDLDGAGTLNGRAGASEFSIGGPGGRGESRRAAERFARRVHGDDDTAAGAKAEIPAVPRRGCRVVPPWRPWRWRPRLLRALHQARRKP